MRNPRGSIRQFPVSSAFLPQLCVFALALFAGAAHATLSIQHWQTANGARVYFVETHDLPMLDVSIDFPAGTGRDASGEAGLATLTLNNLNSSAGGMNEEQLAEQLADVGAQFSGSIDRDRAGVTLRTLSSEAERTVALATLAKIVQQPGFPEEICQREKSRMIANVKQAGAEPSAIAERAFYKALYQDHPYAQTPTVATLSTLERTDMQRFYERYYRADQAVVSILGDLTRAQAEAVAEQLTGTLRKPDAALAALAPVKMPQQAVSREIPHPASQSHIMLGVPGLKRSDPDYFPLLVGNHILGGGGFSSRLTEEVREQRGLVYGVSSYFLPLADQGPYMISLQTKKEQTNEALQVVRDVVTKFIDEGPTETELLSAKGNIIGSFPLRIDSNKKLLDYVEVIGFYNLPLTYLDDYLVSVEKVTLEQIKDAFKRRVDTQRMVTVVVGAPQAN